MHERMRNFRHASAIGSFFLSLGICGVFGVSASCDPFPWHFVVIQHPIVEGGPPSSMEAFVPIVHRVLNHLSLGDSVLCHCRGGVGRAGLLASCVLLGAGICASPCEAIALVRKRRYFFYCVVLLSDGRLSDNQVRDCC